METWIVHVPAHIHQQLQRRALSEGKTPQAVALEILEHDLRARIKQNHHANPRPKLCTTLSANVTHNSIAHCASKVYCAR